MVNKKIPNIFKPILSVGDLKQMTQETYKSKRRSDLETIHYPFKYYHHEPYVRPMPMPRTGWFV